MSGIRTIARFRATLVLAAALLLLGGAGGYGAIQLRQVISRQMRADTVAAICATLQHRQYAALAALVDPAPVPPVAIGDFNSAIFLAKLREIDQHQGAVAACSWRAIQLDDDSSTYLFSLRRPHAPAPIGTLVIVQHEPDNGWLISRRSAFIGDPV